LDKGCLGNLGRRKKEDQRMLLFLDTEYTGFGQPNPKLISLALVAEDGHREFYIELTDTWQVEDCTEFVRNKVLPLLGGPQCTYVQARAELRAWLNEAPRSVQAACDSVVDFRFLLDLLGAPCIPNLAVSYFDLRPLIDSTVYDSTVAAHHQVDPREHHALVDARAYRLGWLAWMDSRKAARAH
jgi:3' exoribonuclease, RNase T-like